MLMYKYVNRVHETRSSAHLNDLILFDHKQHNKNMRYELIHQQFTKVLLAEEYLNKTTKKMIQKSL